jgi:hypothetical protein
MNFFFNDGKSFENLNFFFYKFPVMFFFLSKRDSEWLLIITSSRLSIYSDRIEIIYSYRRYDVLLLEEFAASICRLVDTFIQFMAVVWHIIHNKKKNEIKKKNKQFSGECSTLFCWKNHPPMGANSKGNYVKCPHVERKIHFSFYTIVKMKKKKRSEAALWLAYAHARVSVRQHFKIKASLDFISLFYKFSSRKNDEKSSFYLKFQKMIR